MTRTPTVKPACDVVIIGEYYCDLIFHDLAALPELGKEVLAEAFDTVPGGSFTPALSLRRLGVDVLWHCGFGRDLYSAFVRNEANAAGLNGALFQEVDRPLRRVTSVFSRRDDRGFLTFVDGPDPVADVEKVLEFSPEILMFQGLRELQANMRLAEQARAVGVMVLADCGHVETTLDDDALRCMLGHVDVFLPNAAEAAQLTGEADPQKSLHALGRHVRNVVIKAGADGAWGLAADQVKRVPAKPVAVVDTTGAGDSFNAGFAYGLLRGKSYEDAMAYGVLNGSISTTDLGGRAVPDETQLIAEWTTFRATTNESNQKSNTGRPK